jgi:hypothetical protein
MKMKVKYLGFQDQDKGKESKEEGERGERGRERQG